MRGLTNRLSLAVIAVLAAPSCAAVQHAEPRPPAARVMMFVGDSFTVGSGPVPTWRTYASATARLMGRQSIIAGASGTGYCNAGRVGRTFQRSFEEELSWRPAPDLLVVSGGHNDRRCGTEEVRQAAGRLLGAVRAKWPRAEIVMIGPIWLSAPPRKAYGVRDALAEAARAWNVPFLDPLDRRWPPEAILPDGVHPTLAGHESLAAWLAAELA